jgi:hypothetical protein
MRWEKILFRLKRIEIAKFIIKAKKSGKEQLSGGKEEIKC